jgi:NADH-quinone oxidoreductase subunit J
MATQEIFFYIFAALTLLFGFLVVANPFSRNPVTSAMFLVMTMAMLAGLFVTLHAFFIAAVQILVYAGAVMVLFLFVIMLLDLKEEERRRFNAFGIVAGAVAILGIGGLLAKIIWFSGVGTNRVPLPDFEGNTIVLGRQLFTNYLLPFEIVSVLLLVAMVGAILLSKKELK